MATYKKYEYGSPSARADAYKDYMPNYNTYSYKRPTDTYSDATSPYSADIQKAQAKLAQVESNKPGAYSSAYNNRIDQLIDNMSNRKFTYDLNGDALYQQYKKSYMDQGKQAMADTMGQAAALTGGYGNSYAASVGNQAYQSYLNQLNNKIPELYQLALSRYNSEGEDMRNLYSMLANQESQEYGKYRDTVADYQTDRGYYDQQLQNLRSMGQSLWGQNWDNYLKVVSQNEANKTNAMNFAQNLLNSAWDNYKWGESQTETNRANAVAEDQWAAEQAEKIRQYNEQMAENQRQFNAEMAEKQRQYDAEMAENQRQYNQTYNYNRQKDGLDSKAAALASQQETLDYQQSAIDYINNRLQTREEFNKNTTLKRKNNGSYGTYVNNALRGSGLSNSAKAEVMRLLGVK